MNKKIVKITTIFNETFIAICYNFKRIEAEGVVRTNKGCIPVELIEDLSIMAE